MSGRNFTIFSTKTFSLWCLNRKLAKQGFLQSKMFHMNKIHNNYEKCNIRLLPEIEKQLDAGEMKHRKHPGIRKLDPIGIPEILKNAVYKLVSEENETLLLNEAKDLCNYLCHRRLPIEEEEIKHRISRMYPSFEGNFEEISERLNKHHVNVIKKKLRGELGRWKPIEYDRFKSLAYLVGRLAPNYAATYHVLNELQKVMPDFKPKTYFDFGSGVGSSLWAANSLWSDSIKEYICVDTSSDMNDLCYSLITDEITETKHIEPVFFRQFLPASQTIKYDLVVSAFSLLDLPTAQDRLRTIDTLWRKTKEYMVIIEYGNAAGFHCVLDARDFVLKIENDPAPQFAAYSSGAYVVSPCPHDFNCPKFLLKTNSSCGFHINYQALFPQRFSHTMKKDWISYVIIKKGQKPEDYSPSPRVVKSVLRKVRHIHCQLCCADGNLHHVVITKAKHGRHVYRCARECTQGDALPVNIEFIENETDADG